MTYKELASTPERIRIYSALVPKQILELAISLSEADDTLKSNQKMVVHLAERRDWSDEWLELWSQARRLPEDTEVFQGKAETVYALAWHGATLVDLAYLLKESITDSTFESLVIGWKKTTS